MIRSRFPGWKVLLALALHVILSLWTPQGWWVFAYGAALLAAGLAVIGYLVAGLLG